MAWHAVTYLLLDFPGGDQLLCKQHLEMLVQYHRRTIPLGKIHLLLSSHILVVILLLGYTLLKIAIASQ